MADTDSGSSARKLFGGILTRSVKAVPDKASEKPTPAPASTSSGSVMSDLARRIAAEQDATRSRLDARRTDRPKPVTVTQVNLKVDASFKALLIKLAKENGTSVVGLVELAVNQFAERSKGAR